mgnify:CR=1 FL=1
MSCIRFKFYVFCGSCQVHQKPHGQRMVVDLMTLCPLGQATDMCVRFDVINITDTVCTVLDGQVHCVVIDLLQASIDQATYDPLQNLQCRNVGCHTSAPVALFRYAALFLERQLFPSVVVHKDHSLRRRRPCHTGIWIRAKLEAMVHRLRQDQA